MRKTPSPTPSPADDARVAALWQAATAHHGRGELAAAAALYRQLLRLRAGHAGAHHLLGVTELQSGRAASAVRLLKDAVRLAPGDAEAHLNLGIAQLTLERHVDALAALDRALALQPGSVLALTNRGNALLGLGRGEEAVACQESALRLAPRDPRPRLNLALALQALGRHREALASFEQALSMQPDHALGWRHYAALLLAIGRAQDALAAYRRAVACAPGDADAALGMANALIATGEFAEARRQFDALLAKQPTHTAALSGRGTACLQLGDADAALASYDRALRVTDRLPGLWGNRAEALLRLGRYAEAATSYDRLLRLAPDTEWAHGKRLASALRACDWSFYEAWRAQILARTAAGEAACAPFELLALTDSAALQLKCARRYAARTPITSAGAAALPPAAGERLCVAYVSADFGNHPLTRLLVGVLEAHARDRFLVLGISLSPAQAGPLGERVVSAFDEFIDASALSDERVADELRARNVAIAVDLMGPTLGARHGIFARRPAPVQISYLGYPGSTGSSAIDYLIADPRLVPDDHAAHVSEAVITLPETFQANDDRRARAVARERAAEGLPADGVVLCIFNNPAKITPALFGAWCRILRATPAGVLWLVANSPESRRNLLREAADRGVGRERLFFAERASYEEHLGRLAAADLFLDTFPFTGGATTSDALWAGLPVLTLRGEAFASRMSASLLDTVGLNELVCDTLEDYVRQAISLAADPRGALADLRRRLGDARDTSPLFATARFCRHLETAYEEVVARARRGEAPSPLRVAPQPA